MGVPERLQDESAASISKLCLNIFKETGADVSMYDIDTAHRVPSRNNNGKPKPIVCRFVRRLAKESIMSHRKDACKLDPASVGLPEDASLSAVFDPLSPRMQSCSRRRSLKNSIITSTVGQKAPLFIYGKMLHLELSRSRILVICSTWKTETKAKYIRQLSMVVLSDRYVCRVNKSLLKNLPFSNFDIIRTHGQFNNSLNSNLPTKKYLDKLRSLHELVFLV